MPCVLLYNSHFVVFRSFDACTNCDIKENDFNTFEWCLEKLQSTWAVKVMLTLSNTTKKTFWYSVCGAALNFWSVSVVRAQPVVVPEGGRHWGVCPYFLNDCDTLIRWQVVISNSCENWTSRRTGGSVLSL